MYSIESTTLLPRTISLFDDLVSMKDLSLTLSFCLVITSIAEKSDLTELAKSLTDYFGKYELDVEIKFDEQARNWKITSKKGEKVVEYPEAIAKAVMELRE